MAMARTNVTIPEELLREVDELGRAARTQPVRGGRGDYKVKRERLRRALDASRGVSSERLRT